MCHEISSWGQSPGISPLLEKGEVLVNPLLSTTSSCTSPGAVSKAEQDENPFPSTNHIKNFKPGCQEGDE